MAITQLNDYGVGDFNLTAIINTIGKTYKGKADITISEYDTTAAPDVKVGSVFENNGAIFIVDTSDITPTGYAGISNSTTFYLYFDESGTTFIYSSTAPTWSDSLQGWYNGNDRALFSMYKDSGGTLYERKNVLLAQNNYEFSNNISIDTITEKTASAGVTIDDVLNVDTIAEKTASTGVSVQAQSGEQILTKIIPIGDWDMDGTDFVNITHGLDRTKIIDVSARVRNDANDDYRVINTPDIAGVLYGGVGSIGSTTINLVRITGGLFDSTNYDSTSYNRGWIYIVYEV